MIFATKLGDRSAKHVYCHLSIAFKCWTYQQCHLLAYYEVHR